MLERHENATVYRTYESIEELLEAVQQVPEGRACRDGLGDESWTGRYFGDWQQVYRAARQPWPEGLEVIDSMLRDLADTPMPKPTSRRRRTRFAEDDGHELDYDRLRSGQPYWRTSRRENTRGPATITIVVNVSAHCHVEHRDILWRGAAAIAFATRLEEAGYRVELWAAAYSHGLLADRKEGGGFNTAGLEAVCLKRPGDPIDASSLVSAVSGWFFRTVFFRAWCQGTMRVQRSLGHARPLAAEDLDQITPDRDRVLIDKVFDYGAAVELIRRKLTELTNP